MKKRIKLVSIIMAAILLCLCCSACSGGGRYLTVSSDDYKGLTRLVAGEVDEEAARSWNYPEVNPYIDHVCNVSVHNGALRISDSYERRESDVMYMNGGYFVGVNLHDEGWVGYYPYGWLDPMTPGEMTTVARENCMGFIKIDVRKGYVFTAEMAPADYTGHLYEISYSEESGNCVWKCAATFEDIVDAYLYDSSENCIYIFTNADVKRYSVADGTLAVVKSSDVLSKGVGLISAVLLDGKIYAGSPMGVYEFDPATGDECWYPIDYGKYIK